MEFGFSKEEEEFRQEVRSFCSKEVTPELIEDYEREAGYTPRIWEFLGKVGAKGWLAPQGWHGGIPPVSLVAVVVALVPLLVKRKLAHDKQGGTTGDKE